MSPIDYSPVAIATAAPQVPQSDLQVKLSIQCRGGRTDLVFAGPLAVRSDAYTLSYSIDDGRASALPTAAQPSGSGIAVKGDAVGFVRSLPRDGTLVFRLAAQASPLLESRYALPALQSTLDRLAGPCRWPK